MLWMKVDSYEAAIEVPFSTGQWDEAMVAGRSYGTQCYGLSANKYIPRHLKAGACNWRPTGHHWPATHNIWPARLF